MVLDSQNDPKSAAEQFTSQKRGVKKLPEEGLRWDNAGNILS